MIAKIEETEKVFKPVTLKLTIETEQELIDINQFCKMFVSDISQFSGLSEKAITNLFAPIAKALNDGGLKL